MKTFRIIATSLLAALVLLLTSGAYAQSSDKALARVNVQDASGAVVNGAKVTVTNVATDVSVSATTDANGVAIFSTLPPAVYKVTVEMSGFKKAVRDSVELRVGQQADLQISLAPGAVSEVVEVSGEAPQLNTVSASLGTEITNRYINEMPLQNRSMIGLAYLAPGVTETTGTHAQDLGGAIFSSNGQRYGTAEFRLDGGLLTVPEGGEGGTTNVSYMPSVENIQEFKVQNNSFSSEYGSNGGTVVSVVTKSGTNEIHGSGWYFMRRPALDANSFAANASGDPKSDYAHDQFGVAIGGPIKKGKLFYFGNFEHTRDNIPFSYTGRVPTLLERQGDFSQTLDGNGNPIEVYNPFDTSCGGGTLRCLFANSVVPSNLWDPIAAQVISLFPQPNLGNSTVDDGSDNYAFSSVQTSPVTQGDGKIDYNISDKHRLYGRFQIKRNKLTTPSEFLNDDIEQYNAEGATIEHNWTINPTTVWTGRVGATRFVYLQGPTNSVDPLQYGFPDSLIHNVWYGAGRDAFPSLYLDGYSGLGSSGETVETDTQYLFSSSLSKSFGKHYMKFGGERRIFLNNFFQPANTSGEFDFYADQTAANPQDPITDSAGNSIASFLLGWTNGYGLGQLLPAVANKSMETSFFAQDDWKLSRRLTVNLGLRYEWSTPYTERFDRIEFSCPECDSGIYVPSDIASGGIWPGGELFGTTIPGGPGLRHAYADMNNIAPRVGFAYSLNDKTVIRGGAGVYYGMNYMTNWQYGGNFFQGESYIVSTKDSFFTQYATMENPYPDGITLPVGNKYGDKGLWGFDNFNHIGLHNRNADIYQWSLGVQRQIGKDFLLDVNYSASRSTHLPWKRSPQSINNVTTAAREFYGTSGLNTYVNNPFQFLFVGPNAIFNEPTSIYNDPTIPTYNLVRPYPQYGAYYTSPPFNADATYNALQVRFEKRVSHGFSFVGNYTFSHMWSTSDEGANRFYGKLSAGEPQDKNNLTAAAEGSVSANDTPHRLSIAGVFELPFGRGRRFGNSMNKIADGILGGWKINSFFTAQSGQPVSVRMNSNKLSGGQQRPNLDPSMDPCSHADWHAIVDGTANFFNGAAFSNPGDQTPGTSPRYISSCRVQGIVNMDLGIVKEVKFREHMSVEVHGEFFNFFNHPRFGFPEVRFLRSSFGRISPDQANEPRHGQFGVRFVF